MPLDDDDPHDQQQRDAIQAAGNANLETQIALCVENLKNAGNFFELLESDYRVRHQKKTNAPLTVMEIIEFVRHVSRLGADGLKMLLWSVRGTVKSSQLMCSPSLIPKTATSLYFLAASRWIVKQPIVVQGEVIRLPKIPEVLVAVMSMVLFGGKLSLENCSTVHNEATHIYRPLIGAVAGDAPSDRLLCAIYAALFPDQPKALDISRSDTLTDQQKKELIAKIKVRVESIREVDYLAFTLLIDAPDAFGATGLGEGAGLTPFFLDDTLIEEFFGIDAFQIKAELDELTNAVQATTNSLAPGQTNPTSAKDSDMNDPSKGDTNITFHVTNTGGQLTIPVALGKNSRATANATNNVSTAQELLPHLESLLKLVHQIHEPAIRDGLGQQVQGAIDAAKADTPESKGLIQKALGYVQSTTKMLSAVSGAADAIKAVGEKADNLVEIAKPWFS